MRFRPNRQERLDCISPSEWFHAFRVPGRFLRAAALKAVMPFINLSFHDDPETRAEATRLERVTLLRSVRAFSTCTQYAAMVLLRRGGADGGGVLDGFA